MPISFGLTSSYVTELTFFSTFIGPVIVMDQPNILSPLINRVRGMCLNVWSDPEHVQSIQLLIRKCLNATKLTSEKDREGE